MQRKGMSDVMVLVMLIFVAVAAIVLLWYFLGRNIQESGEQVETESLTVSLIIPYESLFVDNGRDSTSGAYKSEGRSMGGIVKRDAGEGDMSRGTTIALVDEKKHTVVYQFDSIVLNQFGSSSFYISEFGGRGLGRIDSVCAAAKLTNGKTGIFSCTKTSEELPMLAPVAFDIGAAAQPTDEGSGGPGQICGNDVIEKTGDTPEECDPPGSIQDCTMSVSGYGGWKSCLNTCMWGSCASSESCGDNLITGQEMCDPPGSSIACTVGGNSGTQKCEPGCLSVDQCVAAQQCGNNIREGSEVCDGPTACTTQPGGYEGTIACLPDCSGSTGSCQSTARCGDGAVNGYLEACDKGTGGSSGAGSISPSIACSSTYFGYPSGDSVNTFTSGSITQCNADCSYNVASCSPTYITSIPYTISTGGVAGSPKEYALPYDLTVPAGSTSTSPGVNIRTSYVTVDGKGNDITETRTGTYWGVMVSSGSTATLAGITLRNLGISGFNNGGIRVINAPGASIGTQMTLTNNAQYGISMSGSTASISGTSITGMRVIAGGAQYTGFSIAAPTGGSVSISSSSSCSPAPSGVVYRSVVCSGTVSGVGNQFTSTNSQCSGWPSAGMHYTVCT